MRRLLDTLALFWLNRRYGKCIDALAALNERPIATGVLAEVEGYSLVRLNPVHAVIRKGSSGVKKVANPALEVDFPDIRFKFSETQSLIEILELDKATQQKILTLLRAVAERRVM